MHISIRAENIFNLGNIIPVSNSLLTTWLVMVILLVVSFLATRKIKKIPGTLQTVFEVLVDGIYSLFEGILGDKIKIHFPIVATIFMFVLFNNWAGLIPGVGTIGFFEREKKEVQQLTPKVEASNITTNDTSSSQAEEPAENNSHSAKFVPIFRGGTADLNTTTALGLIAVFYIQYAGIKALGLTYFKKFFNFSNPINAFVGMLELILEFAKVISFSFRLFGNVFAGEVLLTVIAFLIPIIAPLPFIGLELFVGFIQALVFSLLTTVFLSLAVVKAEH